MEVAIRDYRGTDYASCRDLWRQLTERHRQIYGDPTIGGDSPGGGLDDYLADANRRASWVAEVDGVVVGLVGIVGDVDGGTVEPVVVDEGSRCRGVGRALVAKAVSEAEQMGIRFLSVQPVARNTEAVLFFIDNGFCTVGHVDLFLDLQPDRGRKWKSGISLHGRQLRY